jgi:hypothetical protein
MASTEAELLHLVDRAEAGTLLAAEAQQLRAGIRRYATAERIITSTFNSAKAIVIAVTGAFQQLDMLPELPDAPAAACGNCEGSGMACSWCAAPYQPAT